MIPEPEEQKPLNTEEFLEQVNSAITAVLVGGQSYRIGSRQLTRADLNMLYTLRRQLQAEVAAKQSELMDDTYTVFFDRR